jgi:hypothetical protein
LLVGAHVDGVEGQRLAAGHELGQAGQHQGCEVRVGRDDGAHAGGFGVRLRHGGDRGTCLPQRQRVAIEVGGGRHAAVDADAGLADEARRQQHGPCRLVARVFLHRAGQVDIGLHVGIRDADVPKGAGPGGKDAQRPVRLLDGLPHAAGAVARLREVEHRLRRELHALPQRDDVLARRRRWCRGLLRHAPRTSPPRLTATDRHRVGLAAPCGRPPGRVAYRF